MKSCFVSGLFTLLVLVSCHKNDATPQEPAGPLEGTWRSLTKEATEYDQQGKVLTAYSPSSMDFTKLAISTTEFGYIYEMTGLPASIMNVAYTRLGNELNFPSHNESFTIKKLTLTKLDLLLVHKPKQSGNTITHEEFLFHFERQ